MDSASSARVITGRVIFLTMTALPESDAATSFVWILRPSNSRRIASATAAPSMMAPSTMLSGGTDSEPKAVTLNVFPVGFSSTALTALDPMSRPTRDFALPNTGVVSYLANARKYLPERHFTLAEGPEWVSWDHTLCARELTV